MKFDTPLEIMVRSRVRLSNDETITEWHEIVRSWKKAWQLVDDCLGDRTKCRVGTGTEHTNKRTGFWFLDIHG